MVTTAQDEDNNREVSAPPSSAWGPTHLTPTQNVEMDVVDRLASVLSVIDHDPEAVAQAGILGTFLCNQHQVAQQLEEKKNEIVAQNLKYNGNVMAIRTTNRQTAPPSGDREKYTNPLTRSACRL